ncbi:hypothetical protein KVR01_011373 [Diaporthe batatas]|uniref:uncharacterized protein n=1 Tax=Diaporthe batatas TaxID=748121 RepID=UPI001D0579B5|nr:uncharacterized protein KVR01_011373 [Diaporthe batatas]KAG8158930.1 hypothetical protein KVR01_011373 [Diaporthe batatas]
MSQDQAKDDNLQGDANTPPTYKEQLDEAAIKVKNPQNSENEGGVIGQVVEKVSQYVPAVGKVLGKDQKEDLASQEPKVPGPPERPHHDTQIEEFIKDQHSSKKDDGYLA